MLEVIDDGDMEDWVKVHQVHIRHTDMITANDTLCSLLLKYRGRSNTNIVQACSIQLIPLFY